MATELSKISVVGCFEKEIKDRKSYNVAFTGEFRDRYGTPIKGVIAGTSEVEKAMYDLVSNSKLPAEMFGLINQNAKTYKYELLLLLPKVVY